MDIDFSDHKLRTLCEQQKVAVRKLGNPGAKKLKTRLADLLAATNVGELAAGHPHPLTGDRSGHFAVDLHGGFRLVFEPASVPVPQLATGGIDWGQVTQVRIVFIGDYHD